MTFVVFLIALVVLHDARSFRADSLDAYDEHIRMRPFGWTFWAIVLPFILPVYYTRRRAFLRAVEASSEDATTAGPTPFRRRVEIETAGVLVAWALPCAVLMTATVILAPLLPSLGILIGTLGPTLALLALLLCLWFVTQPGGVWTYRRALSLSGGSVHPGTAIFLGLLAGLGLIGLSTIVGVVATPAEGSSPLRSSLGQASGLALFWFAVNGAFVAPVLEEVVYRGYFFRVASSLWSTRTAVIAISLLFWIDHVPSRGTEVFALVMIAAMSVTVTVLRGVTGSALASVVAHVAYNSALIAAPLLVLLYTAGPSALEAPMGPTELSPAEQQVFLEKALEDDPNNGPVLNDLAWVLALQEKELDRALSLVEHALRVEPGEVHALDTKAEILWQLGRKDEALELARHLVARDPHSEFFRERLERFGGTAKTGNRPVESALEMAAAALEAKRYVEAGQFLVEANDLSVGGGSFARAFKMKERLREAAVADPTEDDVEPLVRRNPVFPASARRKGLSGWVYLEYTVTKEGRTTDIVVLDADPAGVFDESAIDTVKTYIYRPRGVDGVAVDRPGIQIVLSFDIA